MKVHQNIEIDGMDIGDRKDRRYSKFCNEGKWDNFIKPLIPKCVSEQIFIEFGCNAGLYLRLAKEKGYKRVIGIDKSRNAASIAEIYRDENEQDYEVINEQLGEHFDFDKLPVADLILMANFHYHLTAQDFISIMDAIQYKTCYCLVVSAKVRKQIHWKAKTSLNDLKYYFRNWQPVNEVYYVSPEKDPHPREMWSILFKSGLERKPIKDLWNPKNKDKYNRIPQSSTAELFRKVLESDNVDTRDNTYYKKVLRARAEDGWSRGRIDRFVRDKIELMYDVKKNGFKKPVLIRLDNRIIEGNHRLVMARELGYKSIITRTVY
ncbi:MAG: hypothetical protein PVJ67_04295 [Candidatus Pacearchaeota archaeon]|jgi:SAM-dependent methyltransferase